MIDEQYTIKKMNITRKIAPYFPEDLISIVNKSLLLTEKILTIYKAANFIHTNKPFILVEPKSVENNKERLNYIVTILKKEVSDENIKSISTIFEILINIDKYKNILYTLNDIMSNPEKTNDINNLINIIEPFTEKIDETQKDKLLDLAKMFQTMKKLEPSSKDKNASKLN